MQATLTTKIRQQIRDHALSDPSREVCGLIIQTHNGFDLLRCDNHHPEPDKTFLLTQGDYCRALMLGDVVGVYHSHINNNNDFSLDDIKTARQDGLVWVLYHVPTNAYKVYQRDEILPYLGRPWSWVYRNCFTLFQDFYLREFNHVVRDYWLDSPIAYVRRDVGYVDNLPKEGLCQLPGGSNLQYGDLIISYNGSRHPNHCMIVVDSDKNKAIHHTTNCLSSEINYGGLQDLHSFWRLSISRDIG